MKQSDIIAGFAHGKKKTIFPELSKRNILKDSCFVAEELLSEGFEEYDLSYTNEEHY